MAPTAMECPVGGCQYVTPEYEATVAVDILKIHSLEHSAQPVTQTQVKPRAEKVPRPQIKIGIGQAKFSYFKNRWL